MTPLPVECSDAKQKPGSARSVANLRRARLFLIVGKRSITVWEWDSSIGKDRSRPALEHAFH